MLPLPSVASLLEKLAALGIDVPAAKVGVGGYGDSPELSHALIELIRAGRKRAGTGLLWALEHDGEAMPEAASIEIVVDHENEPVLLTRLTSVSVVPFDAVTAEYAAIEGEGDGSLDYWRVAHRAFFTRECARIGRTPTDTMPVVCSIFEVLSEIPRPNAARR
jgi:uncharacterized protein YhfF